MSREICCERMIDDSNDGLIFDDFTIGAMPNRVPQPRVVNGARSTTYVLRWFTGENASNASDWPCG